MISSVPFTREQFLGVFADYNLGVWPAQIGLVAIALIVVSLVFLDRFAWSGRAIAGLLAALWLWMGVVYHGLYFTAINPMAWGFAALFVVQALALALAAAGDRLHPELRGDLSGVLGLVLIGYALVVYPLLGQLSDHAYPRSPTFGLPCPTTIFGFGVVLLDRERPPIWLLIVPSAWALIGSTAAFGFGIHEDLGLVAALLLASGTWIREARRAKGRLTSRANDATLRR
ncbi:DUF6064 family protein [Nannocystaceae bacterium ST9]